MFSVVARELKKANCLSLHELIRRMATICRTPPKCTIVHACWDWKHFFLGGYLKEDAPDDYDAESLKTTDTAKYLNKWDLWTQYHVYRFKECTRAGYSILHVKEWASKQYNYIPDYKISKGMHLVQPSKLENPPVLQLSDKDHPTEPALFNADHTVAKVEAFFNSVKRHGRRAARNRWGDYDANAVEGPFAEWDKLLKSLIFTREDALTYLGECVAACNTNTNLKPNHDSNPDCNRNLTLGEFLWPHQIPVRTGEGRAVDVPMFIDVIFKSKAPTMTYRPMDEDCDVVYPSKYDLGRDLREQQLTDAKKGKPEILSIKKTHVAIKYIDERGLKGYRVGALVQHVKGNAMKSKQVNIEHMPDWRYVSGRFGIHLTVIVRELFVRKADIDEEMDRFDVTWTQTNRKSLDTEIWLTEDVIAYFDAVMNEKSSMEAASKTAVFFRIPKDICDMIKQKIDTWGKPQVEKIKGSDDVEDVEGNYVGTAEFYDKYDDKKMSGNNLVGEIIMYAYCDENWIVTWYRGKVLLANTNEGSVMYSTSFDDKQEDVELKEDDYGPKYADNKSWFVVKSVNFRIGDMVSITDKVLSVGQEAIKKASDTIVGGKRRRRPTREQEEAKTKQGELLKNQVDESDDDEPLLKKKNSVSTKTKETIITNKATEGTCLEKNVAYTYNDARKKKFPRWWQQSKEWSA